jgi:hypothetical protein
MRITVVGAILIIAGTVVVILVLGNLLDRGNRGPEETSPQ